MIITPFSTSLFLHHFTSITSRKEESKLIQHVVISSDLIPEDLDIDSDNIEIPLFVATFDDNSELIEHRVHNFTDEQSSVLKSAYNSEYCNSNLPRDYLHYALEIVDFPNCELMMHEQLGQNTFHADVDELPE